LISLDSNVLVYAADRNAGQRHDQAAALIERAIRAGTCIQTLQSLCEFYNVATRKIGVDPEAAAAFVDGWNAVIQVEPHVPADLTNAMRAVREHLLSFWDGMLWATARRIGVGTLFTEDFQDGRVLEGVRFVNPFAAHNDALIDRELSR
jgi:predicted nucleic acid-binding protein